MGWIFLWDHIARGVAQQIDPWIAMSVIASKTNKMRLGMLVTPIARRRPWKVAREIVTLDHLSNGRMVLGVTWWIEFVYSNTGSVKRNTERISFGPPR